MNEYKITHEIYKGKVYTYSMPKSIYCKCDCEMEIIDDSIFKYDGDYESSIWYCKNCGTVIVHNWGEVIKEYTREV